VIRKEKINTDIFSQYTVLVIDIYQYSKYPLLEQSLIPFLFQSIYSETAVLCVSNNEYIFQNYIINNKNLENLIAEPANYKAGKGLQITKLLVNDMQKHFICTGDGGYQLFETPIHALCFAMFFEYVLRSYNSFAFLPKLRAIVGELTCRYVVTLDDVYRFDNKYFGTAIINNARLLSKNKLNRFLLDEKTYKWFLLNCNGLETLKSFTLGEVSKIPALKNYNKKFLNKNSLIFFNGILEEFRQIYSPNSNIESVDIMKIGQVEIKTKPYSIYNAVIKYIFWPQDLKNPNKYRKIVCTLGNYNIAGLEN